MDNEIIKTLLTIIFSLHRPERKMRQDYPKK